jgi:membrane-bound lytic murein transglycosylase B
MFQTLTLATLVMLLVLPAAPAASSPQGDYLAKPAVRHFIDRMVEKHGFNRAKLKALFAGARHRQSIIDSMEKPAESLPWWRYRAIFLTKKRIIGGIAFWGAHAEALERAKEKYGVPPAIVTAIIGVESYYGANKGNTRVIDALATLGFDYPPRARFFKHELAQFLLLSRDEHFDPAAVAGSYAGAMGAPQFIASTYRHYAVDFDGDGKSNLWNDWPDIIGSIANYLAKNGWRRGAGVAVKAHLSKGSNADAITPMKSTTAGALRQAGFAFKRGIGSDIHVKLVKLDRRNDSRYFVALNNFSAILAYNHSPLYAMAVWQLANAIKHGRNAAR